MSFSQAFVLPYDYFIYFLYSGKSEYPIFFSLPRLSTEMSMTQSTFMYNLVLFGFFETMTLKVYVAISS